MGARVLENSNYELKPRAFVVSRLPLILSPAQQRPLPQVGIVLVEWTLHLIS